MLTTAGAARVQLVRERVNGVPPKCPLAAMKVGGLLHVRPLVCLLHRHRCRVALVVGTLWLLVVEDLKIKVKVTLNVEGVVEEVAEEVVTVPSVDLEEELICLLAINLRPSRSTSRRLHSVIRIVDGPLDPGRTIGPLRLPRREDTGKRYAWVARLACCFVLTARVAVHSSNVGLEHSSPSNTSSSTLNGVPGISNSVVTRTTSHRAVGIVAIAHRLETEAGFQPAY